MNRRVQTCCWRKSENCGLREMGIGIGAEYIKYMVTRGNPEEYYTNYVKGEIT